MRLYLEGLSVCPEDSSAMHVDLLCTMSLKLVEISPAVLLATQV